MSTKGFDLKEMLALVSDQLLAYLDQSREAKVDVLHQKPYRLLADELQLDQFIRHGGLDEANVTDWLCKYLTNSQHMHHPRYLGHQVAVPHLSSSIADFIHGVINNPMAIYEMGPSAAVIEQVVINWMLDKIGWYDGSDLHALPTQSAGVLTHGGSMANLTAMLAARAVIAPDAWEQGNPNNLVVMGANVAHYSIMRAISIMGLGQQAFKSVAKDRSEVLDPDDLYRSYQQVVREGKQVMAIIANACATSTGLYDPLSEIGAFCTEHKLWFHVDGAHGASALLCDDYRHLMDGVEDADSVIWDTHKMLRTSTLSAAVLFKNKARMIQALRQKGSYLFHEKDQVGFDLMPYTIECTKAALGTKLFWVLASEGEGALAEFVRSRYMLTHDFYQYLSSQSDFECPYKPQANILCFRYLTSDSSNNAQLALRNKIIKRGTFYLTSTEVNQVRYLRVVIINPDTTMDELKDLVTHIRSMV